MLSFCFVDLLCEYSLIALKYRMDPWNPLDILQAPLLQYTLYIFYGA